MMTLISQEKKGHLEAIPRLVEVINNKSLNDLLSVSKNSKKIYLMNYQKKKGVLHMF